MLWMQNGNLFCPWSDRQTDNRFGSTAQLISSTFTLALSKPKQQRCFSLFQSSQICNRNKRGSMLRLVGDRGDRYGTRGGKNPALPL